MKTVWLILFLAVVGVRGQTTFEVDGNTVSVTSRAETGGVEQSGGTVTTDGGTIMVSTSVASDPDKENPPPPVVKPAPPPPEPVHVPPPVPKPSPPPVVKPAPPPPLPSFPVDFSTTEASLRTYIFQADVANAARVLGSPRVISLGAGLTYPRELSPLVEQSSDRNRDPDVVAFKALAQSALDTCDAQKLATAVTLSFTPDCQCRNMMTSEETDIILEQFTMDFLDRKALEEIVKADANRDLVPPDGRRRLFQAGKSPVTSFACAHCWPNRQCRKMHWC